MVKILQSIFLWFYCLGIPEAILVVAVASGIFLLMHKRLGSQACWKWLLGIMMVCWGLAVVYATVCLREGSQMVPCNFVPFHSYCEAHRTDNVEIYRSNFMNVVLFYPAGLLGVSLLPRKWPGWCRCLLLVLVFAAMSAGIEFLQYAYSLGRCEIDDVIHNTAGALMGSLIAMRFCRPSTS